MYKLVKKLFVIVIVSVFMISMVAATVNAVNIPTDKQIEAKEKVAKVKITWNSNGGKIGSKKTVTTSVKKGAKLNKLPTPKRTEYTFKGWYTKKSGGKKINKNTKPTKSIVLFAQWKKGSSRTLNAEEKKLVGTWQEYYFMFRQLYTYTFNKDGTFHAATQGNYDSYYTTANYKASNGRITFTNGADHLSDMTKKYPTAVVREYQIVKDHGEDHLKISRVTETSYRSISDGYVLLGKVK